MNNFKNPHIKYSEIQLITLRQAKELINAINPEKNPNVLTAKELIEKVKYLCKINPTIVEMKPLLARGLASFISYFQGENLEDAIFILKNIMSLHDENIENDDISIELAHGILNVINLAGLNQIDLSVKWLGELELLQKKTNSNQDIKEFYAKALHNLIIICGEKKYNSAHQFLNQFIVFQNQHYEAQNIAVLLSQSFVNMIVYSEMHEKTDSYEYILQLKKLHQHYFYVEEIHVSLAQGYSNLIINSKFQNFDLAQAKLLELEELAKKYPDFEEITLEYIKALGGFLYAFYEKLKSQIFSNYIEKFIYLTGEFVNKLEILSMTIMVLEKILSEKGQIALLPKYLLSSLAIHFTNKNCLEGNEYLKKINYLYLRNTKNVSLALATILSNSIAFKAFTLTNNIGLAREAFSQIELIAGIHISHKEIQTVFIDTKLN